MSECTIIMTLHLFITMSKNRESHFYWNHRAHFTFHVFIYIFKTWRVIFVTWNIVVLPCIRLFLKTWSVTFVTWNIVLFYHAYFYFKMTRNDRFKTWMSFFYVIKLCVVLPPILLLPKTQSISSKPWMTCSQLLELSM